MTTRPRAPLNASVLAAILAMSHACTDVGPIDEATIDAAVPASAMANARAPLPIADIQAQVQAQVDAQKAIIALHNGAGTILGSANARLQHVGYFRRIPSHPTPQAVAANLRVAAEELGLLVLNIEIGEPARDRRVATGSSLTPHEKWEIDTETLLGRLPVAISLRGDRAAIARFIDDLPTRVERGVLVTGHRPLPLVAGLASAEQLIGEAYFERTTEIPTTELAWPPLAAWLRAAGHDPDAAATKAQPGYAALAKLVVEGRTLAPDARMVLTSINDMPRWPARAELLTVVTKRIIAVRGDALLAAPAAAAVAAPTIAPTTTLPPPAAQN
jgi:hypothetical protein